MDMNHFLQRNVAVVNLHHGDCDVSGLFNDHGLIGGLQFGWREAPEGEVQPRRGVRRASWETLEPLYVVLL